ncbi:MAG: nucleotidyltransferase domain-containing protein [Chloroflexi bacterium]|nr:nucleotidyltransferase domain-containing protein [Chloroflexota bacterium]
MNSEALATKRQAYRQELAQNLERILAILTRKSGVEQVILFGSYASGRRDLFTGLDLLVVMQSDQDFVTRSAALRQELPITVDVDLLVYTPEELARIQKRGFFRRLLSEGKVLYEKPGTT